MSLWTTIFNALLAPAAHSASSGDSNCRIQIRVPSEGFWRDYGSTTEDTCAYDMMNVKRGYHEDVSVRTINSRGSVIDFLN